MCVCVGGGKGGAHVQAEYVRGEKQKPDFCCFWTLFRNWPHGATPFYVFWRLFSLLNNTFGCREGLNIRDWQWDGIGYCAEQFWT